MFNHRKKLKIPKFEKYLTENHLRRYFRLYFANLTI